MEIVDALGGEISDLLSLRAVERLQPEIIDSIVARRIDHRFAVMAKAYKPEAQPLEIQLFRLSRLRVHQYQCVFVSQRVFERGECSPFSIGRNIKLAIADGEV